MSILINKHNNDKLQYFLILQSGILLFSFLPTSGLFCKDATQLYLKWFCIIVVINCVCVCTVSYDITLL